MEYLKFSELNSVKPGQRCNCNYNDIVNFFKASLIHLIGDGYFEVVDRGIDPLAFFPYLVLKRTSKPLHKLEIEKYKIYIKINNLDIFDESLEGEENS